MNNYSIYFKVFNRKFLQNVELNKLIASRYHNYIKYLLKPLVVSPYNLSLIPC